MAQPLNTFGAWSETALITVSKFNPSTAASTDKTVNENFMALTETIDVDLGDKDIEQVVTLGGGRLLKKTPQDLTTITVELYPLTIGGENSAAALSSPTTATGMFQWFSSALNTIVSSTATSGASTTLTDTAQTWTTNQYSGFRVRLTGGTGSGQYRSIASNTATALTISPSWTTNPDATSTYVIEGPDQSEPLANIISRNRDIYRVAIMWTDDTAATNALQTNASSTNAMRFDFAHAFLVSAKPSFTDGVLKVTAIFKLLPFNRNGIGNIKFESGNNGQVPALNEYNGTNYSLTATADYTW